MKNYLSVEEVKEIRILMDIMGTNLLDHCGESKPYYESEVRDYINGESKYRHMGKVIFLLPEINGSFIVVSVSDSNTVKFEFNGNGVESSKIYRKYDNLTMVESLRVFIPYFEKTIISLFNFVKMLNTDKKDILLDMGYTNEREVILDHLEK